MQHRKEAEGVAESQEEGGGGGGGGAQGGEAVTGVEGWMNGWLDSRALSETVALVSTAHNHAKEQQQQQQHRCASPHAITVNIEK
jgi:hypothetical protein